MFGFNEFYVPVEYENYIKSRTFDKFDSLISLCSQS